MTSAEWKREAVEHLIDAYKKHPILYNMRHPRYYNKGSRSEALNTILAEMHDIRPETTAQEVLRKIQTLRTQFGQEIAKSRRASKHGVTYNPTAWWFKGLSFLQHHIKHRSISPVQESNISWKREEDDNSFNISIVQGESTEVEINNDYDHSLDGTEYDTEIHYEIDPIDSKNIKTVEVKAVPTTQHNKQANGSSMQALRTTIVPYQSDQLENSTMTENKDQGLAVSSVVGDLFVMNDRNRSLGHFVSSQMVHIKDDYLFYATQMEILNVINRGILKQLAQDKAIPSEGQSSAQGASG